MPETALYFSQPLWLFGLLIAPLVLLWLRYTAPRVRKGQEQNYADAHLLPYLTGEVQRSHYRSGRVRLAWLLAWSLLILAMAGPRWDFERISAFQPAADLVVLLDLSESMNIQDVRPSRLERARQEIQDLLRLNPGIRIGLIAFASVAHVVSPVTEDMQTLQHVLPGLSTSLVRLTGSRVGNALDKASLLLSEDDRVARHILLLSDGDFDEPKLLEKVRDLAKKNIHLHVLGIGTEGGGPVPVSGITAFSRLDINTLKALATQGHGIFQLATYEEKDTQTLLDAIISDADQRQLQDLPTQVWHERFYIPLIPAVLLIMYLFGSTRRYARSAG